MSDDSGFRIFQRALAAYDAPAFIRRARDMEYSWSILLDACRQKREKLLEMPRMRLAMLFKSLPAPGNFPSHLCNANDFTYLEALYVDWSPKLRVEVSLARSDHEIRQRLNELRETFERFNRQWNKYLGEINLSEINLSEINRLRDNYNKYYVLEKECAVLSSEVAQSAFVPVAPATTQQLFQEFPLLRIPSADVS